VTPPAPRKPGPLEATPTKVILDTNAILLPFTQGTRLEDELEGLVGSLSLHVPSSVVSELKRLAENHGATGRAARMALTFSGRCTVEPTGLMGDDGILEVGRRLDGIVVTNDRKLQQQCVLSGLRVIVAREKGRLAWRQSASS
jgi:rRNA-processing protein FCF1